MCLLKVSRNEIHEKNISLPKKIDQGLYIKFVVLRLKCLK